MRLLVVGGTMFLGRHIVEAALAGGHEVTLANRGKTNAEVFPDVEKVIFDRNADVGVLSRGSWDAVIDTCGYFPRHVRSVAEALRDCAGHYTFVSSVSVYADVSRPGVDEQAPVATTSDEDATEITGENYGPLKALCEAVAQEVFEGRCAVVRPGLIVGPHDPSDRFTYWPRRFDLGGEAIVPAWKDMPVQLADARDLAEWMVGVAEGRVTGVFNACGPQTPWTLQEMIDACARAAGENAASPVWVDESFLLEHEVMPWAELPVWIPSDSGNAGMLAVDVGRAVEAGLTFRSIDDVVGATLAWDRTRRDQPLRGPLDADKEQRVLAAWKGRP